MGGEGLDSGRGGGLDSGEGCGFSWGVWVQVGGGGGLFRWGCSGGEGGCLGGGRKTKTEKNPF